MTLCVCVCVCVCVYIHVYMYYVYVCVYIYIYSPYIASKYEAFSCLFLVPYVTNIRSRKLFQYCHFSNKNFLYIARDIWKFMRYTIISTNLLHYFLRTTKWYFEEPRLGNTAFCTYIWSSYIAWCFPFKSNNGTNDKRFCVLIRQT